MIFPFSFCFFFWIKIFNLNLLFEWNLIISINWNALKLKLNKSFCNHISKYISLTQQIYIFMDISNYYSFYYKFVCPLKFLCITNFPDWLFLCQFDSLIAIFFHFSALIKLSNNSKQTFFFWSSEKVGKSEQSS